MLHLIYFHVCALVCETTENIPPHYLCKKCLVTRRQAQCIKMSVDGGLGGGGGEGGATLHLKKASCVHVLKKLSKILT
jgi:hypothetical protein